jgi:hypothetical protein
MFQVKGRKRIGDPLFPDNPNRTGNMFDLHLTTPPVYPNSL